MWLKDYEHKRLELLKSQAENARLRAANKRLRNLVNAQDIADSTADEARAGCCDIVKYTADLAALLDARRAVDEAGDLRESVS